MTMKEAKYYTKLNNFIVQCNLCPNLCIIKENETGPCLNRRNIDGNLFAINYGFTVALHIDPIEKKPLYHYYPGSSIFSLGPNSCNLHCSFCQNHQISQKKYPCEYISPEQLLSLLIRNNLNLIAFTYTEPFTWYEYIWDFAQIAIQNNVKIILVTNGYINSQPLIELLPYIDAMNIDLKSIYPIFYEQICKAKLQPILDTIRLAVSKCHVEITNLVIPNLNDKEENFITLVDFISKIDKDIPLHFSRYFPNYRCQEPLTPFETLLKAYNIATQKLNYVYIGNIELNQYSNTICPSCKNILIKRDLYRVNKIGMIENRCTKCHNIIYGKYDI